MSEPSKAGVQPIPDSASQPYWDAARDGRLLIQRCTGCNRLQFYPRPFCSQCLSPAPEWVEASGNGVIHTYSIVHRTSDPRFAGQLPYVLAVVELAEGVRMTTRILGTPFDQLRCGLPVRVMFERLAETSVIPQFTIDTEVTGG